MELRQLRSFVVVGEELHVGRAAARLHLTQPSVSRQMSALERTVGVALFSRARRRLALTPAGEVFLSRARDVLWRVDQATREAQRAHAGELGTLRLAFVQSATFRALPLLLGAFRTAYPDVVCEARFMTSLQQVDALGATRIDVGLLRPPVTNPVLALRVMSRDPLVAALPAEHPLADRAEVPLAALADEDFILYERSPADPAIHDSIISHCRAAGFSPRIVQQAADVQTITALVAANLGVSLLLAPTPPTDQRVVTYRPLADNLPRWELALCWSPDKMSPALTRFLALADDVAAEL